MSIATDEARKAEASVLERELNGTSWLLGFERGYMSGRSADLTDEEVEAAAFTLWSIDNIMKMPDLSERELESVWEKLPPPRRGNYLVRASSALDAARMAVNK